MTPVNSVEDLGVDAWSNIEDIYKPAEEGLDEDLAKCYEFCLRLADQHNIKSIAFPSLGTGGHAFPIELASVVAYETVEKIVPKTNIEHIYFVLAIMM